MNFIDTLNRGKMLITDGPVRSFLAMGYPLQNKCPELLNLEKPELIVDIHRKYIKAGASLICCNSYGCSRTSLSRHHLEDYQEQIITTAIFNGIKAAQAKVLVAYSMGPTGETDKDFDWYYGQFRDQARIINKFPVDLILIEDMTLLQEARAALLAVRENCLIPAACLMKSAETSGSTDNTHPEAAAFILASLGADAAGIDCSNPGDIDGCVGLLAENTRTPVIARLCCHIQKSGMQPDAQISQWEKLYRGGAAVLGGCCNAAPPHVEMVSSRFKGLPVRREIRSRNCIYAASPTRLVRIGTGMPVVYIAGSEDIQNRTGTADMLYINLTSRQPEEGQSISAPVDAFSEDMDTPFVFGCSDPGILERTLRVYPGTPLIDPVERNPDTLDVLIPVIKKYGASVIAYTADPSGPLLTAHERLETAGHLAEKLKKEGLERDRVIFDCTVQGDICEKNRCTAALDTLSSIKEKLGYAVIMNLCGAHCTNPPEKHLDNTCIDIALSRGLDAVILTSAGSLTLSTGNAVIDPDNL